MTSGAAPAWGSGGHTRKAMALGPALLQVLGGPSLPSRPAAPGAPTDPGRLGVPGPGGTGGTGGAQGRRLSARPTDRRAGPEPLGRGRVGARARARGWGRPGTHAARTAGPCSRPHTHTGRWPRRSSRGLGCRCRGGCSRVPSARRHRLQHSRVSVHGPSRARYRGQARHRASCCPQPPEAGPPRGTAAVPGLRVAAPIAGTGAPRLAAGPKPACGAHCRAGGGQPAGRPGAGSGLTPCRSGGPYSRSWQRLPT